MSETPTCGRGLGRPCHYLTVHSFNYVASFNVVVMLELGVMLKFERGRETFHPIFRRKSHTVMIFLSPSSLFNFYVDYNYSLLILCVKRLEHQSIWSFIYSKLYVPHIETYEVTWDADYVTHCDTLHTMMIVTFITSQAITNQPSYMWMWSKGSWKARPTSYLVFQEGSHISWWLTFLICELF